MARHKVVDGVKIEFTQAEEDARDAEEAAYEAGAFDRAIARLRQNRDRKLASTDYYALSDVVMSQTMTDYRQALRDLPAGLETEEDVDAVDWPVE